MHVFQHDGYDAAWDIQVSTRISLRSPQKRAALNRLIQYASERRDRICYPDYRARHWQIGSGPTESECKTTTHRIKGRGQRWDSENAEAKMALAALHDSGMWTLHWETLDSERN